MPRCSSGGRFSRPASRNPHRKRAPAQSGSGEGIGSSFVMGLGFGIGKLVGDMVMDAVKGCRTIQHKTVVTEGAAAAPTPTANSFGSGACGDHTKAFQECLNNYENDISKCQLYMDMLAECRKKFGTSLSA